MIPFECLRVRNHCIHFSVFKPLLLPSFLSLQYKEMVYNGMLGEKMGNVRNKISLTGSKYRTPCISFTLEEFPFSHFLKAPDSSSLPLSAVPEMLYTDSHLITGLEECLISGRTLLAQNTILRVDSTGCTLNWRSNGFGCSAILPSCLALIESQSVKLKCTTQ